MTKKHIYRVIFVNQNKTYEIYARQVMEGALFGFIEVGDLIFGEAENVVVDPSEEKLRTEFNRVKHFYVPLHAIVRIDEVEKKGVAKIVEFKGTRENSPAVIYSKE
jgi:hypothetical protein